MVAWELLGPCRHCPGTELLVLALMLRRVLARPAVLAQGEYAAYYWCEAGVRHAYYESDASPGGATTMSRAARN